jgi:hypothetical protein
LRLNAAAAAVTDAVSPARLVATFGIGAPLAAMALKPSLGSAVYATELTSANTRVPRGLCTKPFGMT